MNLVGKHQDMVLHAEVTRPFSSVSLSHILPIGLWGLQKIIKGGLGIGKLLFQVLDNQWNRHRFRISAGFPMDVSSIVVNGIKENIVDRGENHDFFCRSGHFPDDTGDGGNHAGAENQPVLAESRNCGVIFHQF